ncbi:MAG: carboxymuconolactone decarboxylase family protein [Myxococcota bacterium]
MPTRIPLMEPENTPAETRAVFETLPVHLDIFKLMAVAENHFRPLLRLGASILGQQELDPKLREFAILQAAALTPGRYEWVQHVPIALAAGARDEQIEALERGDLGASVWDERESLLLRFGAQALRETRVDAELFSEMQGAFSSREIVEVLITLGYYNMLARLTEVVDLDPQSPAGTAVSDAAKR